MDNFKTVRLISRLALLVVAGLFMLGNGVMAAGTVFEPTDGDVNFFITGNPGDFKLRVFDELETITYDGGIAVVGSLVDFDGSAFEATSGTGVDEVTLNLVDSLKFKIGMCDDLSCGTEAFVSETGTNQFLLTFDLGDNFVGTVAFDLNPSPVPLPAAAWLFGSALMGLTVVSRRKKAGPA